MAQCRLLLWWGVASFCCATICCAQLPNPALDVVFPPGGQIGATVDVEVSGRDLEAPRGLVFSHPGLSGTPIERPAQEFEADPHPVVPNRFRIRIADNLEPGAYDVRVVGRYGASTPATFLVGTQPESVETGDNHQPQQAMALPLNQVVNGHTDGGVIDYFQFQADAGQTLMVECLAESIDSLLKPVLTIWDERGKQLARSHLLLDPILEFQVPSSGNYRLGINDHVFGGGATHAYRLQIHSRPFLVAVEPAAARPGETQTFTVFGSQLPQGENSETLKFEHAPLQKRQVTLYVPPLTPEGIHGQSVVQPVAAVRGMDLTLPGVAGSNSLFVPIAQQPLIVEGETPNNAPSAAQTVSVPCDIAGRFYPRRDQDWFQFTAKAGSAFQVRILSHRLGHPTDPEIFVQRVVKAADGQEQVTQVSTSDDYAATRDRWRLPMRRGLDIAHRDASVRFAADQDGEYRVGVRDLNGSSTDDPRLSYLLTIVPQQADFDVLAWTQLQGADDDKKIDRSSMVIRRAESLPVLIDVLRVGGFDGPVRIIAERLPPGVSAAECVIPAGEIEGTLLLSATNDAPSSVLPIQIVAEAMTDRGVLRRFAREVTLLSATGNIEQSRPRARQSRQITLSVISDEQVAATVQAKPTDPTLTAARFAAAVPNGTATAPVFQTSVGGKLIVPLQINRISELKADVALKAIGLPDKCKAQEPTLKPDSQEAQLELTLDAPDIRTGLYTIFLRGVSKSPYSRDPQALAAAQTRRTNFDQVVQQVAADIQAATTVVDQAKAAVAGRAERIAQLENSRTAIEKNLGTATEQLAALNEPLTQLAQLNALTPDMPSAEVDAAVQQTTTAMQQATAAIGSMREGLQVLQTRLSQLQADVQANAGQVQAAEAGLAKAQERQSRAQEFVKRLDAELAEAQKKYAVADVASFLNSPAFYVEILPSPIDVQGAAPIAIPHGETREVALLIARKFGFADTVSLTPEVPAEAKLQAEAVAVAADAPRATLKLSAAADAPVGQQTLMLRINLKFNGVDVVDKVPLTVQIQ